MDVFTPVSTTITTFSCRYCGGSHKGKSGMEIHLKTQKHKDAVQKHNEEEQKKERHLRILKGELEYSIEQIRTHTRQVEYYHRQILELALEE